MLGQVEIGAVGDALELVPAPGKAVLDVGRAGRVVGELFHGVDIAPQVGRIDAEIVVPGLAQVNPLAVAALGVLGRDEILHLHLLELARAEDEVAQRDFVAERLALLGNAEGQPAAGRGQHILEVDEDALRRLRPQIGRRRGLLNRADVSAEHEVELARLGERVGRAAGRASRTFEVILAEAPLARAAVHHRVVEVLHMPAGLPDARRLNDRRVDAHHIAALAHHRPPPGVLDVALELDPERAVVVGRPKAPVNLAGREDKSALLAERDERLHRDAGRSGGRNSGLIGGGHADSGNEGVTLRLRYCARRYGAVESATKPRASA